MSMASLDPAAHGGFAAVGRQLQGGPAIDLFIPVEGGGLFHTWYGPSGWNRGESGDVQLQQIAATALGAMLNDCGSISTNTGVAPTL